RHHYGNGMAQLFLDLPADDADRAWLAADTWARRRKNDGDPRTLRRLRVACWVSWSDSFLTHGDPYTCDRDNHHPPAATTDTATDDNDPDGGGPDTDDIGTGDLGSGDVDD